MAAGEVFIVHQSTVRTGQSQTTEHDSGSAATPDAQQGDWSGNWTSPELTTPAAGQYMFGYSEYVTTTTTQRSVAISQFSIDTGGGHALVGLEGATSQAYIRNTAGFTEATRHGVYLDDLASGVDVKVRSGTVLNSSDRVGEYSHGASEPGGLWAVDFGDAQDYLFASSTTSDSGSGLYGSASPRPIDLGTPSTPSTGSIAQATFSTTDDSSGSTITRSGNTFTVAANSTVLVSGKFQFDGRNARTCGMVMMEVGGSPYCWASEFNRDVNSDHGTLDITAPIVTGGSSVDVEFYFIENFEPTTLGTSQNLGWKSVRFIDLTGQDVVILGKTDADITDIDNTWRSVSFPTADEIADTGGSIDHDGTNTSRINNIAGEEITVLAGSTQFWDRSAASDNTREVPGLRFALNGTGLDYAIASEYNRGSITSQDTWVSGVSYCAPIVIPSGQYIEVEYQDLAQGGGGNDVIVNATDDAAIQFWAIRLDDLGGVAPTTVNTSAATATWSAQTTTVVAGALTVDTLQATAVWSAQVTDTVAGVLTVDTAAATATWTAQPTDPTAGAVSVDTAAASAAWSAQATTTVPGAVTVDPYDPCLLYSSGTQWEDYDATDQIDADPPNEFNLTSWSTVTGDIWKAPFNMRLFPGVGGNLTGVSSRMDVNSTDEQGELYISFPAADNPSTPSGSEMTVTVAVRADSYAAVNYTTRGWFWEIEPGVANGVALYSGDGGTGSVSKTTFGTAVYDTASEGTDFHMKVAFRKVETGVWEHKIKCWPDGGGEPDWQGVYIDSAPGVADDPAVGYFGVSCYHTDYQSESASVDMGDWDAWNCTDPSPRANWSAQETDPDYDETVTTAAASAAWSAQATTTVAGTATVDSTNATAAWSAQATTTVPGAVSVDSTNATATWSAQATDPFAIQTVDTAAATAAWSAQATTTVPGAATVDTTNASAAWTAQQTSIDLDQTLNTAAAAAAWSAQVTDLVAGAATTDTDAAIANWSAQATDPAGGAVSVDTDAASAVWSAQATTVELGAVTVDTDAATAAWSAQITDPVPGVLTVDTATATAAWSAQVTDVVPGTRTVDTLQAEAAWSAQATDPTTGVTVDTAAATAVWSAQATTTVPGTATVDTANAAANWSAQQTSIDLDQTTTTAAATAAWSAQATTTVGGAASVDTDAATAVWSAQATDPIGGAVSVDTDAATANWSAQATTVVLGALTVDTDAAIANWSAQATDPVGGAVSVDTAAAIANWSAQATATVPGTATVTTAAATAVWSAQVSDPVAGAVSVDTLQAAATWSAQATDIDIGQSVDTAAATATWTAQATATVPGTATVSSTNAVANWSAQQTSIDLDQTTTTAAATANWSAQTTSTVPGTAAVDTAAAIAVWSAQDTDPVGGAASVDTDAATAVWSAQATTVVAGTLTVTTAEATAAWSAQATNVDTGQIVDTDAATAVWSAQATATVPGAATVDTDAATANWSAQPTTIETATTVDTDAATAIWTAQPTTIVPGTLVVTTAAATAVWSAQETDPTGGAVTVDTDAATATWTAQTTTTEATITTDAATAVWSAQPTTTIVGDFVDTDAATATWTAQLTDVDTGATEITTDTAVANWSAARTAPFFRWATEVCVKEPSTPEACARAPGRNAVTVS